MSKASEIISKIQVKDLMSEKVIVVHDSDPVSMVITLFERCRISGAPVVTDKHNYIGVISKTDLVGSQLLKLLRDRGTLDDIYASELMTPIPIAVVKQHDALSLAVEKMLNNGLHRLFVENEDGFLIGVISSFDVMKMVKYLNRVETENIIMLTGQGEGIEDKSNAENEDPISQMKPDQKIAALILRKQQEMSAKQLS